MVARMSAETDLELEYNEDCDCCLYGHVHDEGFLDVFHPEATSDHLS